MSSRRGLPERILAVGAHPDDIELSCAGTLARYLQAGCDVQMAVVCRGDRGGSNDPGAGARREAESRAAAEVLGASIDFLHLGDADVWDTAEVRKLFVGLLRRARPDLVITHAADDYHADHVRVGDLVTKCAWFAASVGHVTEEAPLAEPPAVMYWDNIAAIGSDPTHLVDISETMETKQKMLACHVSQLERAGGGVHQLEEMMLAQGRLRGFQAGVRYAEGFRPALVFGRRRAEPLFP